jgi:stress-induced morphogen
MQNIIRNLITQELDKHNIEDYQINIANVSHKHARHFNGNGESHFDITVHSRNILTKKPLERHKILNQAVAELLKTEKVHAISFKIVTSLE